ncbi:MAG: bifunctional 4-hydroxy-2-oxoglutarate aldolase/2-dehydro-3-deoxy-phosphogluconate aldolase [Candidatus Ratteibacteria bacterium]|jgi:2-dehydro-3-deoxyphosphogluconate aldolase/(4S)-4-hydroxy-2-oxoglutarate aldolase
MNPLFKTEIINQIRKTGVIAVLVIDDIDNAVPVAQALLKGGVTAIELTLRTPVALKALKAIRKEAPGMMVGVGTVLTVGQIDEINEAGAAFAVAPGLNTEVVCHAKKIGLSFAPGIVTPSDIENAVKLGCRVLKFFPAEPSGGLTYLKSIAVPYNHLQLQYIPLGGINEDNMEEYVTSPLIMAIGGSWIASPSLIQQKNWSKITNNAKMAVDKVTRVRKCC